MNPTARLFGRPQSIDYTASFSRSALRSAGEARATSQASNNSPVKDVFEPGLVRVDRENGVMTISMNRPDKKNAVNLAMYAALTRALDDAKNDPAVHAVIVTGSSTVFSAGNDLADFLRPEYLAKDSPLRSFIHRLIDMPKPLIAAVEGYAIGIGTTMLPHCDFVYAGSSAKFKMPFAQLFVTPEAASTVLLPHSAGRLATEVLMAGDWFDPRKGKKLGLVNEIVESGKALEAARKRAAELVELSKVSPNAMLETKRLLKEPSRQQLHETADREFDVFAERLKSPEAIEAIKKLLERKP